jgi:hypothetical protein
MIWLDNLIIWITHPKIAGYNIQIPSQVIKLWPSFKTQHCRNLHERTFQFLLDHIEEWDDAYHENCPIKMWDANLHYWKAPNANRESERMEVIRAQLWKLVALGQTPLTCFMKLQVWCNLDVVCCKLLLYCCIPIYSNKFAGKEVDLHPKQ